MSLANRLGTKVYSHLKNGNKKFDFLVDLNSMSDLFFFVDGHSIQSMHLNSSSWNWQYFHSLSDTLNAVALTVATCKQ